ncbi:hypothetical protein V4Y04_37395 [Streptomyces sp. P9-A2]
MVLVADVFGAAEEGGDAQADEFEAGGEVPFDLGGERAGGHHVHGQRRVHEAQKQPEGAVVGLTGVGEGVEDGPLGDVGLARGGGHGDREVVGPGVKESGVQGGALGGPDLGERAVGDDQGLDIALPGPRPAGGAAQQEPRGGRDDVLDSVGEGVDQGPGVYDGGLEEDGSGLLQVANCRAPGRAVAGTPQGGQGACRAADQAVGGHHGKVRLLGPARGERGGECAAEARQFARCGDAEPGGGVDVAAQDRAGGLGDPVRGDCGQPVGVGHVPVGEQLPDFLLEGAGNGGGVGLVASQAPHRRRDRQQFNPCLRLVRPRGEVGVGLGDVRQGPWVRAALARSAGQLPEPGKGEASAQGIGVVGVVGCPFGADLLGQDVGAQLAAQNRGCLSRGQCLVAKAPYGPVVVPHAVPAAVPLSLPLLPGAVSAAS